MLLRKTLNREVRKTGKGKEMNIHFVSEKIGVVFFLGTAFSIYICFWYTSATLEL